MIIFWYAVTINIILLCILLSYHNNGQKGRRRVITITKPNYQTCMVSQHKLIRDGDFERSLSIRTYPLLNCTPSHQLCGQGAIT